MKYYVRAVWKFTEKCEIDHSMFTNSIMQLLYYEPPWLVWVLFEGPAIYLTITSVVQLSWLSAFHSKCSFLPPRDQRDVFVVCCSIHIPAPSSLPSFLRLPLMEASPSSLRHKSLTCAHTHTQPPPQLRWAPRACILLWTWPCISAVPCLSLLGR